MRRLSFAVLATACCSLAPRLAAAAEPVAPTGYAGLLIQTAFVLGGVCLLAFVSLKWGLKRFVAPDGSATDGMCVVARLPVEPRRSILVARVAGRHLILGSSEAGFQSLGELSEEEARVFAGPRESRSFAELVASMRPDVSRETLAREER